MPLNIKDDVAHSHAKQIAAITGESLTQMVRQALADRLYSVQNLKDQKPQRSAERLMALAKIFAENAKGGNNSSDHSDLYDENGLPK